MKRKRIILGAGGILLLIAGAFAERFITKFSIQGIYFTGPGVTSCKALVNALPASGRFVTVSLAFNQATIITQISATSYYLYATSNCIDKLFFTGDP